MRSSGVAKCYGKRCAPKGRTAADTVSTGKARTASAFPTVPIPPAGSVVSNRSGELAQKERQTSVKNRKQKQFRSTKKDLLTTLFCLRVSFYASES